MSELDCGDNSCKYSKNRGGMRTNGGCRCVVNKPRDVERHLLRQVAELQAKLEIARDALKSICDNRCAHQNPCEAREALQKIGGGE
jgi:hypothetical protein